MRVVVDWDGTVTEVDTLHMLLERFGEPGVFSGSENALGRRRTLHEVLEAELATVTAPLSEVVDWLVDQVRLRAGFAEFARESHPTILSAGFHELIAPVLAHHGVSGLQVLANRVRAEPGGWRVSFRDKSVCRVCGEPCKRGAVASGEPFAYVGDGYSDRCVALAANRVFARSGLAAYLTARSVPFEPFVDFLELALALPTGASDAEPSV